MNIDQFTTDIPLLPAREGQPLVLTISRPADQEHGHWYSPEAVRRLVSSALEGAVCDIAEERARGNLYCDRWSWLVRHSTLGFAGPPSHDAVIRLPTRGGESTVTELVDGWIQGARSV